MADEAAVATPPVAPSDTPPAGPPGGTVEPGTADTDARLRLVEAELAQARQLTAQFAQQTAASQAQQVQTALAALPPEQRAAAEARLWEIYKETESKKILVEREANNYGLVGAERELFVRRALAIANPQAVVDYAKEFTEERKLIRRPDVPATEPGLVNARPDAGGTGSARTREEIMAPYMAGGDRMGKLAEMRAALRSAGYLNDGH